MQTAAPAPKKLQRYAKRWKKIELSGNYQFYVLKSGNRIIFLAIVRTAFYSC